MFFIKYKNMASYKKNLEEVKKHLEEGESVKFFVSGNYECKRFGGDSLRSGILAATEKRMVFFAKKFTGYDMESYLFENISSFEKSKGFLGHSISFFASGNNIKMKHIQQGEIEEFFNYVSLMINKGKSDKKNTVEEDIPTQIKKYAELKEQGIITEKEFEEKKKKLLNL